MAQIKPFRAILYNTERWKDISSKVAPPYDVIDSNMQDELYLRDTENIVRIILGKNELLDDKENVYNRASKYYREWLKRSILIEDEQPYFYVWDQTFNFNGKKYKRRALVAKVRALSYEIGEVIPHERTNSEAKDDRFKLFCACGAQFSQIFSLYKDSEGEIAELIKNGISDIVLFAEDKDNVKSELYRIEDSKIISQIESAFKNQSVYIADGHHRYESSVKYFQHLSIEGTALMSLVAIEDPGLVILPTHRAVRSPIDERIALDKLKTYFNVEKYSLVDLGNILDVLDNKIERHAFGFACKKLNISGILTPKTELKFNSKLWSSNRVWQNLDVAALHAVILTDMLGIDKYEVFQKGVIFYSHIPQECINKFDDNFNWVFFLRPINIDQLMGIWNLSEKMVPKSTFFYPKFLSGFINAGLD